MKDEPNTPAPTDSLRSVPSPGIAHGMVVLTLVACGFAFRRTYVIQGMGFPLLEAFDNFVIGFYIGLALFAFWGLVVWNLKGIGWPRQSGEWLWLIAGFQVAVSMASVWSGAHEALREFLIALTSVWLFGIMVAWPSLPRVWMLWAVLALFVSAASGTARVIPPSRAVLEVVGSLIAVQHYALLALAGSEVLMRRPGHRWTHWIGLGVASFGALYFLAYVLPGQYFYLPLHKN
jgi:hypothetical protein